MFREFKAFVNQGNALDLAVGVLIGAAFGKIVNSMVNDIITPVLSLVTGKVDFNNLFIPLSGQTAESLRIMPADRVLTLEEARKGGAVLAYGAFLNNVLEFLIIAFTIFMLVRQINKWRGPAPAKS